MSLLQATTTTTTQRILFGLIMFEAPEKQDWREPRRTDKISHLETSSPTAFPACRAYQFTGAGGAGWNSNEY